MDTPHAWQAFPKDSIHDLDNIRLSDLKMSARERGVDALFELSNIIVEGHARETKSGAPPRGLQLLLNNNKGKETVNTLVMANLGYHQLKANPGVWNLSIREGASTDVFELESIDLTAVESDHTIAVTTFEGVTVFPRFKRKPGMDGVNLLDEKLPVLPNKVNAKASTMFGGLKDRSVILFTFKITSRFKIGSVKYPCLNFISPNRIQHFFEKTPKDPTSDMVNVRNRTAQINIFTVASGLLYEVSRLEIARKVTCQFDMVIASIDLPIFFRPFLAYGNDHDSICFAAYRVTCEVLVYQQFPFSFVQSLHSASGSRLSFRL